MRETFSYFERSEGFGQLSFYFSGIIGQEEDMGIVQHVVLIVRASVSGSYAFRDGKVVLVVPIGRSNRRTRICS